MSKKKASVPKDEYRVANHASASGDGELRPNDIGSLTEDSESDRDERTEYLDFSRELPDPSIRERTIGREVASQTFPMKLHAILSNPELNDIIVWLPHGRAWRILQTKAFEERAIPLYFRHGRYSSFARQVNGWGFRRITHGTDYNSYYHELFLKGMPHLCERMKRPASKDLKRLQKDDIAVPDFYSLSREFPLPQCCDVDSKVTLLQTSDAMNSFESLKPMAAPPQQFTTHESSVSLQPNFDVIQSIFSHPQVKEENDILESKAALLRLLAIIDAHDNNASGKTSTPKFNDNDLVKRLQSLGDMNTTKSNSSIEASLTNAFHLRQVRDAGSSVDLNLFVSSLLNQTNTNADGTSQASSFSPSSRFPNIAHAMAQGLNAGSSIAHNTSQTNQQESLSNELLALLTRQGKLSTGLGQLSNLSSISSQDYCARQPAASRRQSTSVSPLDSDRARLGLALFLQQQRQNTNMGSSLQNHSNPNLAQQFGNNAKSVFGFFGQQQQLDSSNTPARNHNSNPISDSIESMLSVSNGVSASAACNSYPVDILSVLQNLLQQQQRSVTAQDIWKLLSTDSHNGLYPPTAAIPQKEWSRGNTATPTTLLFHSAANKKTNSSSLNMSNNQDAAKYIMQLLVENTTEIIDNNNTNTTQSQENSKLESMLKAIVNSKYKKHNM